MSNKEANKTERPESEAVKEVKQAPAEPVINMTMSQLQEMINSAVQSATQAAVASQSPRSSEDPGSIGKAIAQAIIESRKPFKSDAELANEEYMREQDRKTRERIKRDIEASQSACPHMQGCNALSDFSGNLTSIAQHVLDTGLYVGICTNCLKVFWPEDPEYRTWMSKKSGNRVSRSGARFFSDPVHAQQVGR